MKVWRDTATYNDFEKCIRNSPLTSSQHFSFPRCSLCRAQVHWRRWRKRYIFVYPRLLSVSNVQWKTALVGINALRPICNVDSIYSTLSHYCIAGPHIISATYPLRAPHYHPQSWAIPASKYSKPPSRSVPLTVRLCSESGYSRFTSACSVSGLSSPIFTDDERRERCDVPLKPLVRPCR